MTRITVEASAIKVCGSCNTEVDPEDADEVQAVYECGECGGEFTREENDGSNRCQDCNKFAAKGDNVKTACCADDVVDAFKFEDIEGNEVIVKEEDVWVEPDAPAVS